MATTMSSISERESWRERAGEREMERERVGELTWMPRAVRWWNMCLFMTRLQQTEDKSV